MRFKNRARINADLPKVFNLFEDISSWPLLLKHVKRVDPIEMTATKQHVFMTIESGTKIEILETIREIKANKQICFVQPKPPAPLRKHSGIWNFKTEAGLVVIEDIHEIETSHPFPLGIIGSLIAWHFFIQRNSRKTINEIKKKAEQNV